MRRRQVDLTEAQHRALKERAAALGISEAELVRRAIDAEIGRSRAVDAETVDLFDAAQEVASGHRLAGEWQLDRDELHEEM